VRRITFTLLTLIIGGQAAWSRDAVTAQDQTPLNFVIRLNRYYDGLYTSAPDDSVRHVFFVGEPIDVVVDVGNAGDEEESLDTSTVPMRDAFSIDARQGFNQRHGSRRVVADRRSHLRGEPAAVNWGDVVRLSPLSRVVWEGQFVGPSAPGVYQWTVDLQGIRSSKPVNPQGTLIEYELRVPKNLGDRAEMARRTMIRTYDGENDVEFEGAARDLLNIYPESSLAFELRGRVAERAGRLSEAQAAYETALGLLRDRKDRLFLDNNGRSAAGAMAQLGDAAQRVRGGK
jgi:hypothetical protein